MTAELVRGQNHPLPGSRLEIRVSVGHPVVACVTCADEHGAASGAGPAHPGAPALPGIEVPASAGRTPCFTVDLDAVPPAVHQVNLLLALPEGPAGPASFGATAAPFLAVVGPDGAAVADFTITGLDAETALVAVELYRRQGAWKVRAVGQGYAGGLAQLFDDQGVPRARERAAEIREATAPASPRTEPAPATARPRPGAASGGYSPPATHRPDPATTPGPDGTVLPDGVTAPGSGTTPGSGTVSGSDTIPDGIAASGGTTAPHDTAAPESPVPTGAAQAAPVPPPLPEPGPGRSGPAHRGAGAADTRETPVAGTAAAPGGPISYAHPRRRPAPQPQAGPAPAAPGEPPRPVAGDATGWSMEERLYNQIWGMFEDLARTVAAYRSAVEFAESRMEQELDRVLADPRNRIGGAGDTAREAARVKCEQLTARARQALDRDLAQLSAESEVVEPALPPALARWDNPVWHAYRVPMETPMAVRLGDLLLPEAPELRIPFLLKLPLERGLWVDSGRSGSEAAMLLDEAGLRTLAMECAVAHAARLLAVHPPGDFTVHVIDPAGTAAASLAPLAASGVLAAPPAAGARGVSETLAGLTRRVDLVTMAVRAGAADSLPPDLDPAEQLLIVNDFPHGFDDRAVTQLRYLADEGPAVGVHLMMVADREDASAYGPVLDPLWRSLLRVPPVPDDHLADPWVRHSWTYQPLSVPNGSAVLGQVLDQVTAARRSWGR
ncbi:TerD family protein [Streptomyces sp. CAU 1734]|uniref:TerD family protein n=1 Tax=Streptomyces sp. CAU 1734 TaxID=3140360 RepID=UPI003260229F